MLQQRGGIYASRVIIPTDLQGALGRIEITRSLRTGSRPEALRRLALWETHVRTYLSLVRQRARRMNRHELDALTRRYLDATFDEIEDRLALDWDEPGLDAHRWSLGDEAERLSGALARTDSAPGMTWARALLPAASDETLRKLARRLMEAKLEAIKAELAALCGNPLRMPDLGGVSVPAPQGEIRPSPIKLSEAVARYSEERISRKSWSARTAAQYREIYNVLVDLLGDREMGAVTKDNVRDLGLALVDFPSNPKKVFPGLSPSNALAKAREDLSVARLAPASINMYQQALRSLFQWAADFDIVRQSPATILRDLKTGSAKDDRLPFSDEDLKAYFAVLEREREQQPWLYWIPRIMAFSGCRLAEAAQLRKQDVRREGEFWVLDINADHPDKQLKTDSSIRLVPLHPRLEEEFLPFALGRPDGFLWPEEMRKAPTPERSAVDRLQKLLATRLRAAGVTHPRKTAAHSFRHTVSARLKSLSIPEYQIAEILGHEHPSITTRRYGDTTDLARRRDALRQMALPI